LIPVTEWRVKVTAADVTWSITMLTQVMGKAPEDFEVYSVVGLIWASYWFTDEAAAVAAAALVTLAGWQATVKRIPLALDQRE